MSQIAQVQVLAAPYENIVFQQQMLGSSISSGYAMQAAAITSLSAAPQQQYVLQTTVQQPSHQHQWAQQPQPQPHEQVLPATVFFAGVTPVADCQRLRLLFSQFGRVLDLNLFRPYNGCRTSKGCGLVVFSQHSEATAALAALHGRFVWPGARSPMVIEWCDPSKQHKKKRAQPLAHTVMQQSTTRTWHLQQQQQVAQTTMMPQVQASVQPHAASQDVQQQLQVIFFNQFQH